MPQAGRRPALTLVGLLIAVAVVGLVVAAAIPNLAVSQARSRGARAQANFRSLALGLEAYAIDRGAYPQCNSRGTVFAYNQPPSPIPSSEGDHRILERLPTPVAYIAAALLADPFPVRTRKSAASSGALVASTPITLFPLTDLPARTNTITYQAVNPAQRATVTTSGFEPNKVAAAGWFLQATGPDSNYYNSSGVLANEFHACEEGTARCPVLLIYDPSNGTISQGSLWRAGGNTHGDAAVLQ